MTMTKRATPWIGGTGRMLALSALVALGAPLAGIVVAAPPALAQDGNPFAPRVTVNGAVITNYEVAQRALFLRVLRLPGNPETEAIRALIEDRLGMQAAKAAGITATEEDIAAGLTEFAARANLSAEEFTKALGEQGVDAQTFRDFVTAGLLWRNVVREKFAGTGAATVSESLLDRTLAQSVSTPAARFLLSELFLPVQPGTDPTEAVDFARSLRDEVRAGGSFADAARQYSAAPTGANGGRLDWLDASSLPPPVVEQLVKLSPGEVLEPLVLPNAVALFQLNNLAEAEGPAPKAVQVTYAEYLLAPGQDAAAVRAQVDRCDDLNIVARGQGADRLVQRTAVTSALPQEVAIELAKLDVGESSTALRRGDWTVFLMLCQRQPLGEAPPPPEGEGADAATPAPAAAAPAEEGLPEGLAAPVRAALREQLGNRRLELLAAGYMEELRSEAQIEIR